MLLTATTRAAKPRNVHQRHRLGAGAEDEVDDHVGRPLAQRAGVVGEPAPVARDARDAGRQIGAIAAVEHHDFVPAGTELLDHEAADEAAPADDDGSHVPGPASRAVARAWAAAYASGAFSVGAVRPTIIATR